MHIIFYPHRKLYYVPIFFINIKKRFKDLCNKFNIPGCIDRIGFPLLCNENPPGELTLAVKGCAGWYHLGPGSTHHYHINKTIFFSARMFDFMDSGMMEGLQHNLLLVTQKRTLGKISAPGDTVHLQSQILARRIETDGSVKFLVRWHPQDV